uniref:Uncharacterized protein n=1 Tax=Pavo cristatus TaxID=9049 RepID=A0A8C9FRB6_PAVCR
MFEQNKGSHQISGTDSEMGEHIFWETVKRITIFPPSLPTLCLGKKVQGGDATAAGSGSPHNGFSSHCSHSWLLTALQSCSSAFSFWDMLIDCTCSNPNAI